VRGRAWVSLWGGAGHWLNAAEPQLGPMQVWRVGRRGVGEKKIVFGINTLQIAICRYFIVLPPYPLKKHMTCGSGVRGKASPIWLRI
jgi:hypothetical protein